MDWNWYLFSFEGRINRAKFWLSSLILLGGMLFVCWILFFTLFIARGYLHSDGTFEVSFGSTTSWPSRDRCFTGRFHGSTPFRSPTICSA